MFLLAPWLRRGHSETFPVGYLHSTHSQVTNYLVVTISVPNLTPAVIVLSKLNSRYFKDIAEYSEWTMDFVIYKKGDKEPYGHSTSYRFLTRSVNLEIDLEAGEYVVHVRLDRHRAKEAVCLEYIISKFTLTTLIRITSLNWLRIGIPEMPLVFSQRRPRAR